MRFGILFLMFGNLVSVNGVWAAGSDGSAPGITASASESEPLKAQRLRLIMLLKAKGSDPKSAVVALLEHKQRVQKDLEAMKVEKGSVEFSASRLLGNEALEAARMQMQMQMEADPSNAASADFPTVHTAVCALKAEWNLPSGEGDALALLPATLHEQIKARDLAGSNNKAKLSPADQEKLEELESMMNQRYSYDEASNPTSKILFVAVVPEEVQQRAIAAAFAKAQKQAELLAKSTGQRLGKLMMLSHEGPSGMYAQMMTEYGRYYGQTLDTSSSLLRRFEPGADAVSSVNADDLAYTTSVTVTYSLQ